MSFDSDVRWNAISRWCVCLASSFAVAWAAGSAGAFTLDSATFEVESSIYYTQDSSYYYDFYDYVDQDFGGGAGSHAVASEVEYSVGYGSGRGTAQARAGIDAYASSFGVLTFDSVAEARSASFYDSGGDPSDVGSYYWDNQNADAASFLRIVQRFTIERETEYALELTREGSVPSRSGRAVVRLYEDRTYPQSDPLMFEVDVWRSGDLSRSVSLALNGLLDAGSYRLEIFQNGAASPLRLSGSFVVPEPSTALLVGIGLVGFAAGGRATRRPARDWTNTRS